MKVISGGVTKPLGFKGLFYHVVGNDINAIDGPCEYTLPPGADRIFTIENGELEPPFFASLVARFGGLPPGGNSGFLATFCSAALV